MFSIKNKFRTRFNVPPKLETIAAGFLFDKSIYIAPNPVERDDVAITVQEMAKMAIRVGILPAFNINDEVNIKIIHMGNKAIIAVKSFVKIIARTETGDNPKSQYACPSRLNCG